MSYDNDNFGVWDATKNSNSGTTFLYTSSADTIAVITASGYFNDVFGRLSVGSLIWVRGSDANALLEVKAVSSTATTTEVITHGSGAFFVPFAGEHTTVGGAAAEAITVTGVLATDLVVVTHHTVGGAAQTILSALASAADTITVTFSADPSTDNVVTYVVYRAF